MRPELGILKSFNFGISVLADIFDGVDSLSEKLQSVKKLPFAEGEEQDSYSILSNVLFRTTRKDIPREGTHSYRWNGYHISISEYSIEIKEYSEVKSLRSLFYDLLEEYMRPRFKQ